MLLKHCAGRLCAIQMVALAAVSANVSRPSHMTELANFKFVLGSGRLTTRVPVSFALPFRDVRIS